jgi:putative copper export protein
VDTAAVLIEAAGRWAVYLAALALIGLVSWRLLLWPRLPEQTRDARVELDRLLGARGVVVGLVLLLALGVRAVCQSANAFGPSAALDLDHLRTVAVDSRWGGRFVPQVWAAAAATAAFAWTRVHARSGWLLASLSALAFCAALPRTGHAMPHGAVALGAQALHVLGAGLWIGTLLVAVAPRRLLTPGFEPQARDASRSVLSYFAPVAITGATALVASGALTAYLYLPDIDSLFSTAWGRTLLAKVSVAGVVGTLGFLNFRRFRRLATSRSLTLARVELAVAVVVIALTAILTALPSPGE